MKEIIDFWEALQAVLEALNRQYGDLDQLLEIHEDEICRDDWDPADAIPIPDNMNREEFMEVCGLLLQRLFGDKWA